MKQEKKLSSLEVKRIFASNWNEASRLFNKKRKTKEDDLEADMRITLNNSIPSEENYGKELQVAINILELNKLTNKKLQY